MTVGGVDTYYDYDEHQWKFRRLGGGPVHTAPVIPVTRAHEEHTLEPAARLRGHRSARPPEHYDPVTEG